MSEIRSEEGVPTNGARTDGERTANVIAQLVAIGRLLIIAAVLGFIVFHWSFFSDWLQGIRHGELPFGIKFDREQANDNIRQLFNQTGNIRREGNPEIAFAALKQAALLGAAIQGAKILWVDPNPDNNRYERRIFENMGITVQLAWSTTEALKFLGVADGAPDLVISNVMRDTDQSTQLSTCPVAYYDFPNTELRAKFNGDIWKFNAYEQTSPPAGFAMAELMANRWPALFSDRQRARIIFYTAASGGIAANACARTITNRPDVLFESVVGALATIRGDRLPDPNVPKPQSTLN